MRDMITNFKLHDILCIIVIYLEQGFYTEKKKYNRYNLYEYGWPPRSGTINHRKTYGDYYCLASIRELALLYFSSWTIVGA